MMHANDVLVGVLFPDRAAAERACRALSDYGIDIDDVSLVGPKGLLTPPATEGGGDRRQAVATGHPYAEGAAVGSIAGSAVGFLAGTGLLLSGVLVLPAIGLVIAGPLVGALAGAGLNRSSRSLVEAMAAAGIPAPEARLIEDWVRSGSILLAIAVGPSRVDETREVLTKLGGEPILQAQATGAGSA
jgi:hypothetical protein